MFERLLERETDPRAAGIRQLRRRRRRRRAVRGRGRPHRPRARLPVARRPRRPARFGGARSSDVRRRRVPCAGPRGLDRGAVVGRGVGRRRRHSPVRAVAEPRRDASSAIPRTSPRCVPTRSKRWFPPDPVQEDTASDDSRPQATRPRTSPGSGRCCGSRAPRSSSTARVRAVPHRHRRQGGTAPHPDARRAAPPRGSRAAGTSTWMPRPTRASMLRATFTRGELAEAFAHPLRSGTRRHRRPRGLLRCRAGRRRGRGLLECRRRRASPAHRRAGDGTGSPRPYR